MGIDAHIFIYKLQLIIPFVFKNVCVQINLKSYLNTGIFDVQLYL